MDSMPEKHIMLSYQWDSQDVVKKVYRTLTGRGYNIWMDIEGGISGDINDCMAFGVENSAVIVCFMTDKYEASVNCKRELSYADKKGVTIVPCLVQNLNEDGMQYSPSGWLGILTSSLMYINYRDKSSFKQSTEKLITEIEKHADTENCNIYAKQASVHRVFNWAQPLCSNLGFGRKQKEATPENSTTSAANTTEDDQFVFSFELNSILVDPLQAAYMKDPAKRRTSIDSVTDFFKNPLRKPPNMPASKLASDLSQHATCSISVNDGYKTPPKTPPPKSNTPPPPKSPPKTPPPKTPMPRTPPPRRQSAPPSPGIRTSLSKVRLYFLTPPTSPWVCDLPNSPEHTPPVSPGETPPPSPVHSSPRLSLGHTPPPSPRAGVGKARKMAIKRKPTDMQLQ